MSDFNCPLYNQGLYIEKVSDSSVLVSMCCYQKSNNVPYSTVDFVNNNYLSGIRTRVKRGQPPEECEACWELEKLNFVSYRQGQLASSCSTYNTPVLTNLLYNCENVCNLRCVICGPKYSSAWHSEYAKLGYKIEIIQEQKKRTHRNKIFEQLDFGQLENVHFTGGEPFLTDDHKQILKQAQQHGSLHNLVVSYNTNGTVLPDQETIDLWCQARLVKVFFSLDAVGPAFDYVRYPATWSEVESNIVDGFFKINDLNIMFGIGPTANITNVFYLGDIIEWVKTTIPVNSQGDATAIYINPAGAISQGSKFLVLECMNSQLKNSALDYLSKIGDTVVEPVINKLKQSHDESDDWVDYLEKLDQLRGTNWRNSLSRLADQVR